MPDNAEQAAGEHRIRFADVFDAEIRPHHERFMAAADVRPDDRVIDIGCGTGQSTRDAARAATGGTVLGVDLAALLLERARWATDQEGLTNVTYQRADAQAHRFPRERFDAAISRFGVMFFADPPAAFANIARALRPGARFTAVVWQPRGGNEWSTAVVDALAAGRDIPEPAPGGQHPFSLGDRDHTQALLTGAGFTGIAFDEIHVPVFYGPDAATSYEFVCGLRDSRTLLDSLDGTAGAAARDRLRAVLAEHDTGDGVFFDSRSWIVTARRAP